MRRVSFLLALTGCLTILTACQSTTSVHSPQDRSADVQKHYQEQSADDLQKDADDLFTAGVRYYHSGHFQKALENFIESQQIFQRIEHLKPRVRGRLNTIKAYLSRLTSTHGRLVLRFAENQLEKGARFLNLELLDGAESLLEYLIEWKPSFRNEANALKRRIQRARKEILRKENLS